MVQGEEDRVAPVATNAKTTCRARGANSETTSSISLLAVQCRIGDLVQDRQLAGAYVGFAKAILGDHSLGMQGRGRIDPGAVIRPDPGEWHPRMPERLGENELADWRAGRDAIYQLAALTVGARLAVADG